MYQPLNIVIREAKLTDFLTDLAAIFNTNDSKLKSEIEKIVNGLQLNTVTGVIGEPDSTGYIPINEIDARTMFVVLPGSPTTGPKFGFKSAYNGSVMAGVDYSATAIEPYTVNFASDVYSLVMGTRAAGYIAYFDKITVASVFQASLGKFTNVQMADVNGLLDVSAVAQFNGPVIHRSGHKESILETPLLMQVDPLNPTVLYCEYNIGRTTPENIFLHLQFDSNGYTTGWVPTITDIQVRLKIDPTVTINLPLPGQVFNLILKDITTSPGNVPITLHPDVDIVAVANETVPATADFQWKNYGANGGAHALFTRVILVPSSVTTDSLDTYGSALSLIYNKETPLVPSIYTSAHRMYVRNKFAKE